MRGKKIQRKCKNCNNQFEALMIKVRQGKGLFCSKSCYTEYRKNNAGDAKELNKKHQRKFRYNLTEEQFKNMIIDCNNKCTICEQSFNDIKMCIDHSHDTGKVRGLLCDDCNKALGLFKDSTVNLKNAIDYLKR
tara:strand:- start:268 stop:669 length:402 start_codon:yes stop_codon:yes gene_type:complete